MAAVTSVLAAVVLLAGCSGGAEESGGPETPATSAPAETGPPPLTTRAELASVVGRLPAADRDRLQERVVAVVDDWIDAAFTEGEYPRAADEVLDGAFAGFTPVARERALRDRALMSNADLADRLDGVRATRRQVRLDVLAVRGRAVGVTARTVLELQLSGQVQRRDRVSADLFLTYVPGADGASGGWRVFGYDVARGRA
ncbi:hypothetical protein [Nocardioides nanhaiensis]|uniref:hypothetical protein n=1 Tax=Nocardioides nanhaiensis TaxID=1476871 RepID=UPI0031ED725D